MDFNALFKAVLTDMVKEIVTEQLRGASVPAELDGIEQRLSKVEQAFTAGPDDGFIGGIRSLEERVEELENNLHDLENKAWTTNNFDKDEFIIKDDLEEVVTQIIKDEVTFDVRVT